MATRIVEGKKPYTGGKAITVDENKVISLNLREENNLIIYDAGDNEIYVDLQLPDELTPTDAFPVGITTGRVIVDNGWDLQGTLICAKTTSGDNIKLLYADEGTLWIDNGTGTFKQIYFKADVDGIITTLTTYINGELAKKQNGVTSDTAPSNPSEGDLWYDTVNDALKVYNGSSWVATGGGGGGSDIEYVTQAEYEALLPGALTDNKHYFIYEEEVGPTPPTPASRPTITGFTYDSKSFGFGSQEQEVQGMIWKPDGTKFYLEGEGSDHVYQYSCSTAYDVSTASYDNVSLDVSGKTGVPTNIRMKPDGTQLYLVGGWDSPNHIWIYNLGTAWDLSTAVYSAESPQIDNNTNSIFLSPDGLNLFTYSLNTYLLKRFPLSTAWDLTSFSTADQTASLNNNNNVQNVYFNPDGTQMFSLVRTGSGTKVGLYSLSTGWDLTTLSNTSTETIDSGDAMAISFKEDDGSKMYLCWRTNPNRTIYQYSTTTA